MYKVDGFLFEDEATASLAKKEEDGIRFIKQKTALDNPEIVFRLYKSLLAQKVFVTPVGIRFLVELQNILLTSTFIAKEEIPAIPASTMVVKQEIEQQGHTPAAQVKKATEKVDKKVGGEYKRPFYIALFFAIIFGLSVIGMFVISEISGNNVNIINYREAILNEYSQWQEELQEKENELTEWEKELEAREAGSMQ